MGYIGQEFTSQDSYILSDTIPYNPEFDLEELKRIQDKIERFTSGNSAEGLTAEEATIFLDWITFNSRSYAARNTPETPVSSAMSGQCAPTQRINVKLLSKFGLDARDFNTADCIGEIPMNGEDIKRIKNGYSSTAVKHSISLVNLPIQDMNGTTYMRKFALDPTFRQFCLKENCDHTKFSDEQWLSKGYVAPHPGFFMQKDNLEWLKVDSQIAQKSEDLCRLIISRGYFELTDENAKLYGDAFVKSSKRWEFQNYPINMSGRDYIRNFENIRMGLLPGGKDDDKFLQKPSEILEKESNKKIGNRISNFLKRIFGDKTKRLQEGNMNKINIPNSHSTFAAGLNPENYEKTTLNNNNHINNNYIQKEKDEYNEK